MPKSGAGSDNDVSFAPYAKQLRMDGVIPLLLNDIRSTAQPFDVLVEGRRNPWPSVGYGCRNQYVALRPVSFQRVPDSEEFIDYTSAHQRAKKQSKNFVEFVPREGQLA